MDKNPDYKNFYDVLKLEEGCILVVDPLVINMKDLMNLDLPVKYKGIPIVRIRRPFWGHGNVSEYINKVSPEEMRAALEKLEVNEDDK
jgi:hypothetical protein